METKPKPQGMTVGEFVRRATPLVAEKYGIRLDQAEELVRRTLQDDMPHLNLTGKPKDIQ